MLLLQLPSQHIQFCAGIRGRSPFSQARRQIRRATVAVRNVAIAVAHAEHRAGHPCFEISSAVKSHEAMRRNTDDRERLPIQTNAAAEHLCVAAKAVLPCRVTEDRYREAVRN